MIKTEYNYTCPKCNLYEKMELLLAKQGEFQNQYFYTCSTQVCRFYLNTGINTKHDFSNFRIRSDGANWWKCENNGLRNLLERDSSLDCEDCINAIKINMLDILSEFVECTWGVHYMTVFENIIKPYLDNLEMLKFFLQSTDTIIDEYNNVNGYKMYGDLHHMLNGVENIQINKFIQSEF
jgi:hypothetical protein